VCGTAGRFDLSMQKLPQLRRALNVMNTILQHIRGMFAFAIWNEARQMLFCATDGFVGVVALGVAMQGDERSKISTA
jgi:asparagine synthetase B (glutamine-hydrolysing)